MNYDQLAVEAANYCYSKVFTAHRGAMPTEMAGVSLVFGNDGPRWRGEVELLRERLMLAGIEELGYGENDERDQGYSWAMLVRSRDCDLLSAMVWDCWKMQLPENCEQLV
jgi:hypothetical protein